MTEYGTDTLVAAGFVRGTDGSVTVAPYRATASVQSVVRNSVGRYTITLRPAVSTLNSFPTAMIVDSSLNGKEYGFSVISANSYELAFYDNVALTDMDFFFEILRIPGLPT